MSISIKFEPRDLWIGAFWNRTTYTMSETPSGLFVVGQVTRYDIYVCLVPMLPIRVTVYRRKCVDRVEVID